MEGDTDSGYIGKILDAMMLISNFNSNHDYLEPFSRKTEILHFPFLLRVQKFEISIKISNTFLQLLSM